MYYAILTVFWANPGAFLLVDSYPLSLPETSIQVRIDGFATMADCEQLPTVSLPFTLTLTDGTTKAIVATERAGTRDCHRHRNR